MMPGALISMRRRCGVSIGPLRVHHAPHQRFAHRHVGDAARALDRVAFLDVARLAEDRDAYVVLLEVEHHAVDAAGEFHQLARHDALKAVDARDAVALAQHGAGLGYERRLVEVLDLLLDDLADFFGSELRSGRRSLGLA
jgi:hypothetical protein